MTRLQMRYERKSTMLKKANKFKISLNTIETRLADISSNIQYLIKNIKLYLIYL